MPIQAVLGGNLADQGKMNSELAVGGNEDITKLDLHAQELQIWNCRNKESTQILTGSEFVVGHNSYSIVGTSFVGPTTNPYIMSNVWNAHDLFPEYFYNDRFIGSDSTGSWNESDSSYQLEPAEYFETDIIAKEDKAYKYVNISIDSEYSDTGEDSNSILDVTASIGSQTFNLLVDQKIFIDNEDSTNGLKLKINNGASGGVTFGTSGLPFPITLGTSGGSVKINNFLVKYGI